jgi:NTP pyrophosphatase (non-canonical NTP hydrolase)
VVDIYSEYNRNNENVTSKYSATLLAQVLHHVVFHSKIADGHTTFRIRKKTPAICVRIETLFLRCNSKTRRRNLVFRAACETVLF